jgi:hypothetical protein
MNTPTFFSLFKKSRFGIPRMRDSNHILDQQRLKRKMKERRLKILGKKIEPERVRPAIPKPKKKTNGNGKKK